MGTGTVGTALGQTAIGQFLGGATGAIQGPGLTGGAALGQQFAGTMSNILPVLSYFAIAIAGAAVAAHQFAAGWRIDGNGGYRTNNPVAPLFMATQMDRTYRALGFNDQWAAILSGSSMATRMFGRRARQNDAMGVRGVIDPAGVTGTNWQDWSEQGGWFTSTRRGTYDASNNPAMAFDSEQRQFFVSMMAPVTAMVARVSARYGVDSASALSGYSRSFDLQLNENGNPLSDERISQLFTDLFVGVMQDQVAIILQEAGQTDLAMYVRGITGTGQEIASMIQTIMDFLSATDHLDPETILSDSSRSAIQMYRLQGEELLKLARNTNLSTESLGQLITATGQYRNVA
ncbi:MAG TPA: hypothetical protein DEH78_31535, partial [Solibacterales bacterium]|nr:hypothetical protein [Bryobacterales bacterium]